MQWVATVVWSTAHATTEQLSQAAEDLDGDLDHDIAAGLLSVRFELIAATRDEAIAVAHDLSATMSLPEPNAPISAQECPRHPPVVEALNPEMTGRWLVKSQGSDHIWDLDRMTYTRIPSSRSRSGPFDFDRQAMVIARVERWPRVGFTPLLWYDDPSESAHTGHWRQSSRIVSITEI